MGVRQENYWLRQADALSRHKIANTAFAISMAMAEKGDRQKALDSLELTQTAEESKKQLSESWWGLNKLEKQLARVPRGGRGV